MNAGRAKLADAQTGCPADSPFIHPPPALALNGVKVKDFKVVNRAGSAVVALSARKEKPLSSSVRQKEQLLDAQRSAGRFFGSFLAA
jgi:hypothetical protein